MLPLTRNTKTYIFYKSFRDMLPDIKLEILLNQ